MDNTTMETITLRYDATNPALRGLLNAFLKLDGVTKVKTPKVSKRRGLDEAIDDVKHGRSTRCASYEEYLEKIEA